MAHQLLEWHHMLSGWYPMTTGDHLRTNMAGDALFHLARLVEGLVDHQLLGVHHVRSGPHELAYDVGFLVLGAALVAVGTWLGRRGGAH